ncbi:MAG TPA: 3'-5' exonuclease [Leptolyngbyaceae cyanobacterium M65_K2018_010]|nr:3'-5' exonuclease [Leptolyngbyaceae cyanobacterium M65_K2018_010]
MFKSVGPRVCAFDLEWVPDPKSGRRVYHLPDSMPDQEVFQVMWEKGGATPEKPRPYLKTALCRVVSVAAVIREQTARGDITLRLTSLPKQPDQPMAEGDLIATFLAYVGRQKPQLIGFNSHTSDLPILLQRGIAAGITAADFCQRPDKPWAGTDYFARHSQAHIDLKDLLSGWGIGTPSLHELASVMGIPGKIGTDGSTVVDLWVEGNLRAIVAYNQYDALTTYLVWLRTALFAGFFTPAQYQVEEQRVRDLIHSRMAQGEEHLTRYLDQWNQGQRRSPDLNPDPESAATPDAMIEAA